MGGSHSIHVAHPEGWHHRLKPVACNEEQGQCGGCTQPVRIGEVAYRCSAGGCPFVLHKACKRPKKTKHFAHSCSGRRDLTLTDVQKVSADRRTCGICAVDFDDGAGGFVYGCGQCHGFYAHPRCCDLPQKIHNSLHPQHALTLLAPQPPRKDRRGRRCVNTQGSCKNARRNSDAWSYQCSLCDVELCLKCQLPDDGGPDPEPPRDGCNVLESMAEVAQQLATVMGMTLNALACACIGNPKTPTPLPEPAPK